MAGLNLSLQLLLKVLLLVFFRCSMEAAASQNENIEKKDLLRLAIEIIHEGRY